MSRCLYYLLVWLFAFYFNEAKAQTNSILKELRMEHLTTEQGLASNSINVILQDSKGFMWFVTGNGLNRYDGYNFRFYGYNAKDSSSITSGWFDGIIDNKNAMIWLSNTSFRRLYSFLPATEKFKLYEYPPNSVKSSANSEYQGIASDSTGIFWMATTTGLNSYDPKTKKKHLYTHRTDDKTTIISNNISQIEKDDMGKLWLLMKKNNNYEIDYFDPYKGKVIEHITERTLILPANLNRKPLFYHLNAGKNGNLWIGCEQKGLYNYNVDTKKTVRFVHDAANPYTLGNKGAYFVTEDHSGNLWIINGGNKLDYYDSSTGRFYRVPSFNNSNDYNVNQIFEDKSGNIWIATQQDGIYTFNPFQKKIRIINRDVKSPNSLTSNIAICTFKTITGQVLLGTGKGITIFNQKTGSMLPFEIAGNKKATDELKRVLCLYQDSKGVIWICSSGGFLSYDPVSKKHRWYRHHDNDPNSLINASKCNGIIEDTKGRYWITIWEEGFESFEPVSGKFHSLKISDGHTNSSYPVGNLVQSSNGNIYIGSWGGGFVIFNPDNKTFKIYRHNAKDSNSLSGDIVFDCYEKNGIVWLCTNGGGLNAFDPVTSKFKSFTMQDGLCNNGVTSIAADNKGHLWLGTMNGISCFTPPDHPFSPNCKIKFRNYDVSDGLPSNQMYLCTAYKAPDGIMYFGTYNKGFFYFNPDELNDNTFIPPVFITGLNIFNHPVKANDSSKILSAQIEDTRELKLGYKQNAVSFTFAALNYVHPEKNSYAYKLEGFDKEWTFTDGTKHFADYTNLNPGKYTFRVKASNNDGVWNQKGASLKLTITPPYWQTWWFKMFCFVATGLILYTIWYNQMRKSLAIKSIRNKIASNLHDDLGATLSSISIMSVLVHQQIKDQSPLANALLDKIGSSSRNMIDSVNDMVWAINPKNDNFENIIKRMRTFASEILTAKDIVLHFDFDKNLMQSKLNMDKRENFYLIFKEAVNNSAKYSHAKNAFVIIWNQQKNLKMIVRDDGNGFELNTIVAGNGLTNMRHRAESMKATFNIESIPGVGTTIELGFKNE
jgi:ligand-binding sensor domain-containing protein/two-component sensor histidine kinase